jgi:hypothetical protein
MVSVQGQAAHIKQHTVSTGYFYANVLCTSSGTWSATIGPLSLPPSLLTHGTVSVSGNAYGSAGDAFSQAAAFSGPVTLKVSKS